MKTRLIWFCLGLSVLTVRGGDAPERIRVHLQALLLNQEERLELYYHDGERFQVFDVPSSHFRSPVLYEGPNPMVLLAEREDPGEGEETHRPVDQVHLPQGAANVVLLISVRNGRLRTQAVPLVESRFPPGGLFMMNFSERELQMGFGEDRFRIQAGRSHILVPARRERHVVSMTYRFADDEENVSLASNKWFYNPRRRYFVFIFDEDGRVGLRSVTWFETPDQEQ